MGAVWKTVLTFAVVVLITVTGISVISANGEVTAAEHYLVETAMVIQESSYHAEIIADCQREAEDFGYRLEVQPFYGEADMPPSHAYVQLHYQYRMPVFGISVWKMREIIL